jgi:hypothetical protein
MRYWKAKSVLGVAAACAALVGASASEAARAPGPGPGSNGDASLVFSQSGSDANLVGASSFAFRFGHERQPGPAGDACVVREKSTARSFAYSPFGLPRDEPLWLYLDDERRPAKVTFRRWSVDPNSNPGAQAESIPVRRLVGFRFEGKISQWAVKLRIPSNEPSWLVARVAWADPDDCADGNDYVMAGVSFGG